MSKSYKRNQDGEQKREQYFRSERRRSKVKRGCEDEELLYPGYSEPSRKAWYVDVDWTPSALKG